MSSPDVAELLKEIDGLKAERNGLAAERDQARSKGDENTVGSCRYSIGGLDHRIGGLEHLLAVALEADSRQAVPVQPPVSSKKRKLDRVFMLQEQRMKKVSQRYDDDDEMFSYIEMKDFPPMLTRNLFHSNVLIRECYYSLYDQLLKFLQQSLPGSNYVISGNPGIGKSYFYLYCIFRLIKDGFLVAHNKILLLNANDKYWKFDGTFFETVMYNEQLSDDSNIIRFIDGDSDHLVGWSAISVLFTSPKAEGNRMFNAFRKHSSVCYMPVWDLSELQNANSLLMLHNIGVGDLLERFAIVGGVARYASNRSKTPAALNFELKQAIANSDTSSIIHRVKSNSPVSDVSSWLLKMIPIDGSDGWQTYNLDFQSNTIAEMVVEACGNQSLLELKRFALENIRDPNSSTFRGTFYEALFHKKLKYNELQGKKKPARALSPNLRSIQIVFARCQAKQFNELSEVNANCSPLYYYPKSKTFESIDGIYVNAGKAFLFQTTISASHPVKNKSLKKVIKVLIALGFAQENIFLMFVVPKRQFDDGWTAEQQIVSSGQVPEPIGRGQVLIQQYAVCVDWTEM